MRFHRQQQIRNTITDEAQLLRELDMQVAIKNRERMEAAKKDREEILSHYKNDVLAVSEKHLMDKLYRERLLSRHQAQGINQQSDGRSEKTAPGETVNTQKDHLFNENTDLMARTDSGNQEETERDRMLRMRREERLRRKASRRMEEEVKMIPRTDSSNVLQGTMGNNENLEEDASTRNSSSVSPNRSKTSIHVRREYEAVTNGHQGSFLDALGEYEQKKRQRGHFDHAIPQRSPIETPSRRDQRARLGDFISDETRTTVDNTNGDTIGSIHDMRHHRSTFDQSIPVDNPIGRLDHGSKNNGDLFSGLGRYEQNKKNGYPFDHRIPSPHEPNDSPSKRNDIQIAVHHGKSDHLSKSEQLENAYYKSIHDKDYVTQHKQQQQLYSQEHEILNPRNDYRDYNTVNHMVHIPERENQAQQQVLRPPSTELERKKALWREEQKILERLQEQEMRRIKEERRRKAEKAQRYAQELAQQLAWNSPSGKQRKVSSPRQNSDGSMLMQRDYPRDISNWVDSNQPQPSSWDFHQHTNPHPQSVGKTNSSIGMETIEPPRFINRELQIEKLRNAFESSEDSAQQNQNDQNEKQQGGFMNKLQRMMDGRDEDSIQAEKEKKRRYREELEKQMREQRREKEARMSATKGQDDPASHTRLIDTTDQNVDGYVGEEVSNPGKGESDPEHSTPKMEGDISVEEDFDQQRDVESQRESQQDNRLSHTETGIDKQQHRQIDESHKEQKQQSEISLIHKDGRVMRGALLLSNPGEIERRRRKQQMQEQLRRDLDKQMERARREKEAKEAEKKAREEREERLEKERKERPEKETEEQNHEHGASDEQKQAQNPIHHDPDIQVYEGRKSTEQHPHLINSIEEPEEPSMETRTEDVQKSESQVTEEQGHDTTPHNCSDENIDIQNLKEMEGRILNSVLDVLVNIANAM